MPPEDMVASLLPVTLTVSGAETTVGFTTPDPLPLAPDPEPEEAFASPPEGAAVLLEGWGCVRAAGCGGCDTTEGGWGGCKATEGAEGGVCT